MQDFLVILLYFALLGGALYGIFWWFVIRVARKHKPKPKEKPALNLPPPVSAAAPANADGPSATDTEDGLPSTELTLIELAGLLTHPGWYRSPADAFYLRVTRMANGDFVVERVLGATFARMFEPFNTDGVINVEVLTVRTGCPITVSQVRVRARLEGKRPVVESAVPSGYRAGVIMADRLSLHRLRKQLIEARHLHREE